MKLLTLLTAISLLLSTTVAAQTDVPGDSPIASLTEAELTQGQELFGVHCARCHGMLGEGGEGPNLKRPRLTHAANDMALFSVISQGIPGTGMPATWAPAPDELWRIAGYVKSLGQLAPETMPGDPARGKLVYDNPGNCASCHITEGLGRGVGPELTEVGLRRNQEYLQRAISNPAADQPRVTTQLRGTLNSFLTVRVVSEYGVYEGMRINEDEFSVQMRDLEGTIYSFAKPELISYEKDFGHSLMPGYSLVLNQQQVDDLVSYLMSLKGER